MEKDSGVLDNPVINYLPSKFEDLVGSAFFKPGGEETRDWFKSRMNNADIFGSGDKYLPHQVAKWLGGVSKGLVDKTVGSDVSESIRGLISDEGGLKRALSKLDPNKKLAIIEKIRNMIGASHFSDPSDGKAGMGMSYSRMLGHALQAGGVTAAALTLPYANKRRKQHRDLDKAASSDGPGFLESIGSYLESNSPVDLTNNQYSPWKRGELAVPGAVIAAMLAYKGTKHGITNITDKISDRKMDERDQDLRRQLSRLMVADNRSQEDGEIKKFAAEKDNHGNSASKVLLPILMAIWAGLIPPFYGFGKKMGEDTSENAQYEKLINAFNSFERESPKSTKFQTGNKDSVIEQKPGKFLGSRNVILPVPDKGRASSALSEIF